METKKYAKEIERNQYVSSQHDAEWRKQKKKKTSSNSIRFFRLLFVDRWLMGQTNKYKVQQLMVWLLCSLQITLISICCFHLIEYDLMHKANRLINFVHMNKSIRNEILCDKTIICVDNFFFQLLSKFYTRYVYRRKKNVSKDIMFNL